jgi:hypothetical protein
MANVTATKDVANDESQLARLKAENARLTELVAKLKVQHKDSAQPLSKETSLLGDSFCAQLQKSIHDHVQKHEASKRNAADWPGGAGEVENGDAPLAPTKASPFHASGLDDMPQKSAIYICKSGPLKGGGEDDFSSFHGEDKAYVCVMDVPDDEWWEIIEPEVVDMEPVEPEVPFDSDSSYEIIGHSDLTDALSDFVTSTIEQHPETFSLSDKDMRKMLEGTFAVLKEKGTLGKALEYGTLAYTAYGWGSYAFQLYTQPGMYKYVIKGVYTAGSWLIWLIV